MSTSQSVETLELVLAAKKQAERLAATLDAIWWRLRMERTEHNGLATMEDVKLAHVLRVLQGCNGCKARAARVLNVDTKTVQNLMRQARERLEICDGSS
jgi:transcriptional regulator with GAF, ATPase, and Fis domain